jgi:predicted AAA+ superfamily ATPase
LRDLAETAVFHELLRRDLTVRAWRSRERLGLAVVEDSGPKLMVDVAYGDRTPASPKRLASAMKAHGCELGLLLAEDEGELKVPAGTIFKRSFARWLQGPDLPGITADSLTLPAYLL